MDARFRLLMFQGTRIILLNGVASVTFGLVMLALGQSVNTEALHGALAFTGGSMLSVGFGLSWWASQMWHGHEDGLYRNFGIGPVYRFMVAWICQMVPAALLFTASGLMQARQ